MKALIAAPGSTDWDDLATATATPFYEEFVEWVSDQSLRSTFLKGNEMVKINWDSMLQKPDRPTVISAIGHGNPDSFTGYKRASLIAVRKYDATPYLGIAGHFLSCQIGQKLLPFMVEQGASKVLIGYNANFSFYRDESVAPLQDPLASPFFTAHLLLDREWYSGKTAKQAKAASDEYFRGMAKEFSSSRPHVSAALISNMKSHVLFGNPSHCIISQQSRKTVRVRLIPKSDFSSDVEFQVTNDLTEDPVPEAEVLLDALPTHLTDSGGITLFKHIKPGSHTWIISKQGFKDYQGTIYINNPSKEE